MRARAGFTLAELLVAVAILVLLGMGLYGALASTIAIWRRGESQRQTEEEGRSILAQVTADLESVFPIEPVGTPTPGFFVDVSPGGDVLIRMARARGGRDENFWTRQGGEETVADGSDAYHIAGHRPDPDQPLRALGGVSEVFFVYLSATRTLWRGERAPVGGPGSLFDWNTVTNLDVIEAVGTALSRNVLAFDLYFWGPETTTWDPGVIARAGGPLRIWDSTAANPDFRAVSADFGALAADLGGAFLPVKVRLSIVVASPDGGERTARLSRALEAGDTTVAVNRADGFPGPDDPFPYMRIEDEWVRLRSRQANLFTVERGARGSTAVAHPVSRTSAGGATEPVLVQMGRLFAVTVEIPVSRTGWGSAR